jgi:hypothetical protein
MTFWTPSYDSSYTLLDMSTTTYLQHPLVDVIYIDGSIGTYCKSSEVHWFLVEAWRVSKQQE